MRGILLPRDLVESELEVDEGEQESEEPVQTQVDRLAAVVMLDKLFAEFVDDDDPKKPGEEKAESGNEGSDCPVQGTGTVIDFANPEAEVKGPCHGDSIHSKVSIGLGNEPECECLSRHEGKKQKCPMNPRRRRIDGAAVCSVHNRGPTHTVS